jgi:hypothetical protein
LWTLAMLKKRSCKWFLWDLTMVNLQCAKKD